MTSYARAYSLIVAQRSLSDDILLSHGSDDATRRGDVVTSDVVASDVAVVGEESPTQTSQSRSVTGLCRTRMRTRAIKESASERDSMPIGRLKRCDL